MRITVVVSLFGALGIVGCAGMPGNPIKSTDVTSIDVIGAPGGYRVHNVTVSVPDLACGGRTFPEARDASVGGFKRSYIEAWNSALDVKRLSVLTPKSASERKRHGYLSSHFIKMSKDAEEAMHEFDIKPTRTTMGGSSQAGTPTQREDYRRASCVRDAYTKGSTQGGRQADDDVRAVIERAPPDV